MPLKRLTETGDLLPEMSPKRRDTQTTSFSIDGVARFTGNTWEEVQSAAQGNGQ